MMMMISHQMTFDDDDAETDRKGRQLSLQRLRERTGLVLAGGVVQLHSASSCAFVLRSSLVGIPRGTEHLPPMQTAAQIRASETSTCVFDLHVPCGSYLALVGRGSPI